VDGRCLCGRALLMVSGLLHLIGWLMTLPFRLLGGLLHALLLPVKVAAGLLGVALFLLEVGFWVALAVWIGTRLRLNPALCAVLGLFRLPGVVVILVVGMVMSARRSY